MFKAALNDGNLKEVQPFIGISSHYEKNENDDDVTLVIDLYRAMSAGNSYSLSLIEKEVLSLNFNNRIVLIAIPEEQRVDTFPILESFITKRNCRRVIINLNTNYKSGYSSEVVSTSKEQFILEKELLVIHLVDIEGTQYYAPFNMDDPHNDLVTIRDSMKGVEKPYGDKAPINALNALQYIQDVASHYYKPIDSKAFIKHFWLFNNNIVIDQVDGKVIYCCHSGCANFEGIEKDLTKIKIVSKCSTRGVIMAFFDPSGERVKELVDMEGLAFRFRDPCLYGADLVLADVNISFL